MCVPRANGAAFFDRFPSHCRAVRTESSELTGMTASRLTFPRAQRLLLGREPPIGSQRPGFRMTTASRDEFTPAGLHQGRCVIH
jgi:hypothetical protein